MSISLLLVRHLLRRSKTMTVTNELRARMNNPAVVVPDVLKNLYALGAAASKGTVPATTLLLVQLRASQINGCALCVDMHARELKEAGESNERLFAVAAWYDAPYFNDAERAAL